MAKFTGHSQKDRKAMRNTPTKVSDAAEQEKFNRDLLRPGSDAARLNSYSNYRQKKVADEANKRAMALERLKQSGQTERTGMTTRGNLAVADRQQTGATKRQGMITGLGRERLGLDRDKFGFYKTNENRKYRRSMAKDDLDRFKTFSELSMPALDENGKPYDRKVEFSRTLDNWTSHTDKIEGGGKDKDGHGPIFKIIARMARQQGVEIDKVDVPDYIMAAYQQEIGGGAPAGGAQGGAAGARSPMPMRYDTVGRADGSTQRFMGGQLVEDQAPAVIPAEAVAPVVIPAETVAPAAVKSPAPGRTPLSTSPPQVTGIGNNSLGGVDIGKHVVNRKTEQLNPRNMDLERPQREGYSRFRRKLSNEWESGRATDKEYLSTYRRMMR